MSFNNYFVKKIEIKYYEYYALMDDNITRGVVQHFLKKKKCLYKLQLFEKAEEIGIRFKISTFGITRKDWAQHLEMLFLSITEMIWFSNLPY